MRYLTNIILCLSLILAGCPNQTNNDYVASPGFSQEKFSEIHIGMTLQQVLDTLGPPLSVFGPIESSGAFRLNFTCPTFQALSHAVSEGKNYVSYHSYSVKFSKDCLVIGKTSCKANLQRHEGLEQSIHANMNYQHQIGNLTFTSQNGVSIVLDSNDPSLHIILLDKDCPNGRCSINSGPFWLQTSMQDMINNRTIKGVKHLYIGDHTGVYLEHSSLISDSKIDGFFIQTKPVIELTARDKDSGILLYKAGMLHSVPFIRLAPNENGQLIPYEIDILVQQWIINKLGQE